MHLRKDYPTRLNNFRRNYSIIEFSYKLHNLKISSEQFPLQIRMEHEIQYPYLDGFYMTLINLSPFVSLKVNYSSFIHAWIYHSTYKICTYMQSILRNRVQCTYRRQTILFYDKISSKKCVELRVLTKIFGLNTRWTVWTEGK